MKRFRSNTTMFSFVEKFGKAVSVFLIFSFMSFNASLALVAFAEDSNLGSDNSQTVENQNNNQNNYQSDHHDDEDGNDNQSSKINICHKNGNSNSWNALNVSINGWNGHSGHADDYIYNGPVKNNGKPTNDGDDWCKDNAPKIDVCLNIDGVQTVAPEGYVIVYRLDHSECVPNTSTIKATKVVCDSEADLPNWGAGGHGPITDMTATNFVAQNGSCHIEAWDFAWAENGVGNPGDNKVGTLGNPWHTFSSTVDAPASATVPAGAMYWVREQPKDGYVPFSGWLSNGSNTPTEVDSYSAELYCSTDVLNYDNYDYLTAVAGMTYHCVAFNALKKVASPVCNPNVNLIENGDFEAPALTTGTWNNFPDSDALLKWLVAWANPTQAHPSPRLGLEIQNHAAGSPFAGNQLAELDGDSPVTIWQNIATIPNKIYTLTFKYSPRPSVSDNRIKVKLNGTDLGAELSADGSSNGDTVWQTITRTFTATGTTSKIEFTDTGKDDSLGGYLDNVDLRCTGDACNPEASQTVVSDATSKVDNHDAVLVANPNAAWATILGAKWIWDQDPTSDAQASNGDTKIFTKTFTIAGAPSDSSIDFAVDNGYDIKVNGSEVCADAGEFNYGSVHTCAIPKALLATGTNTLSITVTNLPIEGSNGTANPAGVIFKLTVHNNECLPPVVDVCTNIPGVQATMPQGYKYNSDHMCVPDVIESPLPVCSDTLDNDNDGLKDEADPACHTDGNVNNHASYDPNGSTEVSEGTLTACNDGLDNDGDNLVDSNDPGCHEDNNLEKPWTPNKSSETNSSDNNGGGGNGGGDGRHGGGGGGLLALSSGRVLGASTSCGIYVDKFLRRGYKNDTDAVKKLQKFLNDYMNAGLKEDGNFNLKTEKALKKFQLKHADDVLTPWGFKSPTGIFYLTTQTKVNNIMCPDLKLQIPPLTPIEENPLAPKRD